MVGRKHISVSTGTQYPNDEDLSWSEDMGTDKRPLLLLVTNHLLLLGWKCWHTLCLLSVGFTSQMPDNCVCLRHVVNVGPTRWRHSVVSVKFLAVGVVSVRLVADTLSYMFVGISTNEVVTSYEDKKNWNVYRLFFILSDFSSTHRIQPL